MFIHQKCEQKTKIVFFYFISSLPDTIVMKNHNKFNFIDTEYLYGVSQNNDFLKKIFSLFKKEVKTFKKDLLIFLKEKNFEELAELVHKAKSSISILGMIKQAESMRLLETDILNSAKSDTYETRINQFISDCENAVSEIEVLEKTLS